MSISAYLKEIGRGKDGARALDRAQAADLFGQLLDGQVPDLALGAFCIAMRVKGETPEELAGFLDAIHARLVPLPAGDVPTVVLPSYNGARKLPVLTPLLALSLARHGLRVLLHGQTQDPGRVTSHQVLRAVAAELPPGQLAFPDTLAQTGQTAGVYALTTAGLLPGLQRLLDARRVIGLRNPAHSLVKLLNPCAPPSLLVSSYTHPEYLHSMSALFRLTGQHALLLRGTEGEPVADARRTPQMDLFAHGRGHTVQATQAGPLTQLPTLPPGHDVAATAAYTLAVLRGQVALPTPIALQVQQVLAALPSHVHPTSETAT
ncbi:DNA-binding protein YbiB [Macromonas nakdongensis]|uniref:DNA-binding protein YbiB n=1 Tax=Macromonas nakdongensis TaxID=1843082 RepID=UPI000C33B679|nr:DNA-binding protein YbiB [Macromonas nakdongensis]